MEALPLSEFTEWRAYLNGWPSGEEAMDLRIEVLRRDLVYVVQEAAYNIGRAVGAKGGQQPKPAELSELKIFNRLGEKNRRSGGKFYDEMTPEQVNKRMRVFATGLKGKTK